MYGLGIGRFCVEVGFESRGTKKVGTGCDRATQDLTAGRSGSGGRSWSTLAGLSMDLGFLDSIRGASHGKAFLKQSGVFLRPATKCSYEGPERSALS